MSKDKEESRNIPPVQDLNLENVEKKRIAENGGVKSGDLSSTSPVANYEIKEHNGNGKTKPKDDKKVQGPSGVKCGDLSATSRVNAPHSNDETEFVDIEGIDEDENKGLTAAQVLRAQLDAEEKRWNMQRASRQRQRQRQAQLYEKVWRRRNEQRSSETQRQTSSSSSNDIESCDENSVNALVD